MFLNAFFFFVHTILPKFATVKLPGTHAETAELNRLEIIRAFFMSDYIR